MQLISILPTSGSRNVSSQVNEPPRGGWKLPDEESHWGCLNGGGKSGNIKKTWDFGMFLPVF